MAVEIRAATYAALRAALAAGTYKIGQSVFVEAANPGFYGFGTGWFQVRNAAGLTDDSLSTFVGGSYAALRHTGDAWAAYTNAISFLDAPGKHPAFSHTRATVGALCQQFDGSFYQPEIGEIGSHGMRRVRNLLASTDTLATQGVTVEAADYWLSFTGTGSVAVSGVATDSLAGTGVSDRVSKKITAGAAGTMTLTVTGSVTNAMLTKSRAGQLIADPQYVSRGVLSAPYHGWGIDGVRCFATGPNGEDLTDAASGYPVRAAGAVDAYLATNRLTQNQNVASWAARGTASVSSADDGSVQGGYLQLRGIDAVSVNDVYRISTGFTASGNLGVALLIRPVDTSGVLRIQNAASGIGNGQWTIDLSAIPVGRWSLLNASHSAVTVLNNFVSASTSGGLLFSSASGGPLDVDISVATMIEGTLYCPVVIPTAASAVAVAADASPLDKTELGYDDAGGTFVVVSTQFSASDNQQIVSAAGAAGESWSIGATHTVVDGGVTQASIADSWSAGDRVIHAVRIEANDIRVDADGANVGSDASATMPTITGLSLGGGAHSQAIEAVYYFPPGTVTDAQLLAMSNGDLPTIPELA